MSSNETLTIAPQEDRDVLITHVFDAPREMVFRAWTDPEILARWFAPNGCTLEVRKMDLREGGTMHTCIRNPDYPDCWCVSTFLEITPPERIAFTMALADEEGSRQTSDVVGKDPDWPDETTVTVTFAESEGKTRLTLHQNAPESVAKRTGAYPSWLQMLDRLAGELRG